MRLLPTPVHVEWQGGSFALPDPLPVRGSGPGARLLAERLIVAAGLTTTNTSAAGIDFHRVDDLPTEGYHLTVTGVGITIRAADDAGERWAVQTLLQLLPAQIHGPGPMVPDSLVVPCVSAMVGDQFDEKRKHLASKVFAIFYWSINFGSFFASLLIPKTLKLYGPQVAFGVPGILMLIATIIFWAGRKTYVIVPPRGPSPHSFLKVVLSALRTKRNAETHWLDRAKAAHPEAAVEGAKAVFRVITVFLPIPFFWMLFDQKASTWVVQAKSMDPNVFGFVFEPSQMQLVNPAMVMILIPLTTGLLYPAAK